MRSRYLRWRMRRHLRTARRLRDRALRISDRNTIIYRRLCALEGRDDFGPGVLE